MAVLTKDRAGAVLAIGAAIVGLVLVFTTHNAKGDDAPGAPPAGQVTPAPTGQVQPPGPGQPGPALPAQPPAQQDDDG